MAGLSGEDFRTILAASYRIKSLLLGRIRSFRQSERKNELQVRKADPQSIALSDRFMFFRARSSSKHPSRCSPCSFSKFNMHRSLSVVLLILVCTGSAAALGLRVVPPATSSKASFSDRASQAPESAPLVTKVEPPSWWARHSINPVRLLIRGQNLFGARVRATKPGIRTSGIVVNPRGTYLFVNVTISTAARPGSYPLTLTTAKGSTTIPFTIESPLAARSHFQGITSDDVIYLIMPDRFADGDQSNNIPPGAPPAATDRKNSRSYHGGDLRGIINHLPYLKELGVTALWLTPWYDNWNGVNNCDKPWCPNTYYHGYHAIDYYASGRSFRRFGDAPRVG